jgi:hypothetical protein
VRAERRVAHPAARQAPVSNLPAEGHRLFEAPERESRAAGLCGEICERREDTRRASTMSHAPKDPQGLSKGPSRVFPASLLEVQRADVAENEPFEPAVSRHGRDATAPPSSGVGRGRLPTNV